MTDSTKNTNQHHQQPQCASTRNSLTASDFTLVENIFKRLDKNGDGKICLQDLINALVEKNDICNKNSNNNSNNEAIAKRIFHSLTKNTNENNTDHVTFQQFIAHIIRQHETLSIVFDDVDNNKDIDKNHQGLNERDIRISFARLGMPLKQSEARRLLHRMSQERTWKVDNKEWREFMLFHIKEDYEATLQFWKTIGLLSGSNEIDMPEDRKKAILTTGCAAISAIVSRTATAPLDRIRVMRQVYGYKHTNSHFWDVGRYMIQEGGFLSMWRGNGTNLIKIVPEHAVKLSVYRFMRMYLHEAENAAENSTWVTFLAGSIAGTCAQSIVYPMEVVKTRMCLRKTKQYSSIMDCIRFVYKDGGLRAFYRGYFVSICGVIPCTGIEMGLYDTCRKLLHQKYFPEMSQPPIYYSVPLIGFSISVAMIVTYPLQLIRTKFQSKAHFAYEEANNLRGLVKTIYSTEGISGFYRGLAPNFLKVLPAYAISYSCYEMLNKKFDLQTFRGNNNKQKIKERDKKSEK